MPIARSGIWVPPSGLPTRTYKNPVHSLRAEDGRRYETCPQCSSIASLRSVERGHDVWRCDRCGYVDCVTCPLGDHEKN